MMKKTLLAELSKNAREPAICVSSYLTTTQVERLDEIAALAGRSRSSAVATIVDVMYEQLKAKQ